MRLKLRNFRFAHPRLERVKRDILQRYPPGVAARPLRPSANLSELLSRIERTPFDEIDRLAQRLSISELDTLVYGCLSIGDELAGKVETILSHRWRRRFAVPLWNHFCKAPTRRMTSLMAKLVATRDGKAAGIRTDPLRVAHALAVDAWMEELGQLARSLLPLQDACNVLGFGRKKPVSALVSLRALPHMSAAQIRAESGDFLAASFETTHELARDLFAVALNHYLQTLSVGDFDHDLLTFVHLTLNRPEVAPSRWRAISDDARAKFNKWLARLLLDEILGDDNERSNFWRRFSGHFENAFEVKAGNTTAIALLFPTFVAVEFLRKPNACYLYTRAEYERYVRDLVEIRGECSSEGDLKILLRHSIKGSRGDNRIFHHQGWKQRSYPTVRQLILAGGDTT